MNVTAAYPNVERANQTAFSALLASDPVLTGVQSALEAVPGMTKETVLTSGAPLPWEAYEGGQREAIIGAVRYEGLANSRDEAIAALDAGDIKIGACHDYGCIGSLAGIYTASMPVFVVENRAAGNVGFCNFYEGSSPQRLNYGVYNDEVIAGLRYIEEIVAPVIGAAVALAGEGLALKPIMRRAIHLGDELHSRNTAGTLLFTRALFPYLLDVAEESPKEVRETIAFLDDSDYFFLRLGMAAAKAAADAAHDIKGSSIVTAMSFSCQEFALRISGLGDWVRGPLPDVEAKLFDGFTKDDVTWMGGESSITETVGLGGFAQAAAFPLQAYQGGSPEEMARMNLEMYEITQGEHDYFKIPFFGYRGTPTGIDIRKVVDTGITPVIDAGVAGKDGGQIGAGTVRPPLATFEAALREFERSVEPAG